MRFAWALVVMAAGCRFDLPQIETIDAATDPDGSIDGSSSNFCYGATNGLVKVCFAAVPTGDVPLPPIDTDTSTLCTTPMSGGNGYCVIAGNTIHADEAVAVTGSKPLVLVAVTSIDIANGATLDVASHHSSLPPRTGAGAGAVACAAGTPPVAGSGGGGGAGGSFAGIGGNGGNGGGGGTSGKPGVVQGATTLRGGCPGQDGINGTFGVGGKGGGAVYLIASTINIVGAINASGEGGHPGLTGSAGGGGGGAGGMIGLDAPTITNSGVVFANGASGGEGSGTLTAGNLGPEPTSAAPSPAPVSYTTNGGDGGGGSAGGSAGGTATGGLGGNGSGGGTPGGGGGGGGGVGVIKVYRGTLTGQFSPPAS